MVRRSRRMATESDKRRLLAAIGVCRQVCVSVLAKVPIGSSLYLEATELIERIDDLAELLAGRRDHFWSRGH